MKNHCQLLISSEYLLYNHCYVIKGWDSWDTNKQFEANYIPFELKFRLPKLRKSRIIFDRDSIGRIIHSRTP